MLALCVKYIQILTCLFPSHLAVNGISFMSLYLCIIFVIGKTFMTIYVFFYINTTV